MFENAVDTGLLGREIRIANEIVMTLLLDLELLKIDHFLYERATGTSCRHHRYVK